MQHDISNVLIDDEDLREEFAKYDPDGNGWVTKAAFTTRCREFASFGPADTEERIKEMLEPFDKKGADKLSYNEFCVVMLQLAAR